ncbi:MAG: hypothetical protein K0S56_940 [Microvirga sp.]|jgi:hypothetical protein|nr:hypothetical protein [Microvirga sp.]
MKSAKLRVLGDDEIKIAEISGDGFAPDPNGTTLICGRCDGHIIEGYKPDFFQMDDVALVCQHCGARNHMVLSAL